MIKAFGSNILAVRIGSDRETSSGIVRTSSNKEKPMTVEIIDSKVDGVDTGKNYLIARYSGTELEYEGTDYIILNEDDIIAEVHND